MHESPGRYAIPKPTAVESMQIRFVTRRIDGIETLCFFRHTRLISWSTVMRYSQISIAEQVSVSPHGAARMNCDVPVIAFSIFEVSQLYGYYVRHCYFEH